MLRVCFRNQPARERLEGWNININAEPARIRGRVLPSETVYQAQQKSVSGSSQTVCFCPNLIRLSQYNMAVVADFSLTSCGLVCNLLLTSVVARDEATGVSLTFRDNVKMLWGSGLCWHVNMLVTGLWSEWYHVMLLYGIWKRRSTEMSHNV